MRSLHFLGLASLAGILLAACGGGGGGGGLSPGETALVGSYVLDGFDIQDEDTLIWTDETDHLPWSGNLTLRANGTADGVITMDGTPHVISGSWSADNTTFTAVELSDGSTSQWTYTLDPTHFVMTGDFEIYSWLISGP